MRTLRSDSRELIEPVSQMHPPGTFTEWLVVDTVGTVHGPISDEVVARELAEPLGRRLLRRTVDRNPWSEVAE